MSTDITAASIPDYVQRYLNGESMQSIARDCGVHRATLYRHMLRDLGENHEDVVTDMLITRIAKADEMLEQASSVCDIARAREIARYSRMDFERRRPHLYGQRQQLTVEHKQPDVDRSKLLRTIQALEQSLTVSEQQHSRVDED